MGLPYDLSYVENLKRKKVKLDMSQMHEDVKKFKQPEPTIVNMPDMSHAYNIDMNGFLSKFDKIDMMNDNGLAVLVQESYLALLDASALIITQSQTSGVDLRNNPSYMALMKIFTNSKLICILSNILKGANLDYKRRIYVNRIVYNYIILPAQHKDQVVEKMMFDLGDTVNAKSIPNLLGTGISRELASMITIAANSSEDEYVCIRRVNLLIFNVGNLNIMTLQRIVDIYQYTFNKSVTKLFEGIMFDVYSPRDLENATSDQKEIYQLIVTAVLELINQMPSQSIRMILTSYYMDFTSNPNILAVRASMNLSEDYYRINDVIELMKRDDNMYLP